MAKQTVDIGTSPNDQTGDELRVAFNKLNQNFDEVYTLLPSAGQLAALAGTSGTPSVSNRYVTDADSRLTNSRTPSGSAGGSLTGTFPNPTIASQAVALTMLANMAQNTIMGRISSGTGSPEHLTAAQVRTILGVTPIANFTDLADVPNSYTGHGSKMVVVNSGATGLEFVTPGASYADENAQDAIGTILDDATLGNILFTYVDATPKIHASVKANSLTNAMLTNMAESTIKGRASAGSGSPEDLTASQVRSLLSVYSEVEVDALLAGVEPFTLTGNGGKLVAVNSGETAIEYVDPYTDEKAQDAIGAALDTTASLGQLLLLYNDGSNKIYGNINDATVTYAKIQNVTANRLLGRESTTGPAQEISIGSGLNLSGGVLSASGGGFSLTNGSGTTAGATSVDLGGTLSGDTAISGSGSFHDLIITDIGQLTLTSNALTISSVGAIDITSSGGSAVTISGLKLVIPTGASDPTGSNGSTYYNTTTSKFRSYEGGSWKNTIFALANGSGTTASGSQVNLGGTLTANTTIAGATFNFTLSNVGTFSVGASSSFLNGTVSAALAAPSVSIAGTTEAYVYVSGGSYPYLYINSSGLELRNLPSATSANILYFNTSTNRLSYGAALALNDGDKGDITVSGSGATWTIDNDAVTYAKLQNVSATSRILGRISSGAGNAEELTGTQTTTLLDVFTTTLKGLVPASGGGTTNFLRADGTWASPGTGGSATLQRTESSGLVTIADADNGYYIYMDNAGGNVVVLPDSVAVNTVVTIVRAVGGGSVGHLPSGTAALRTLGSEVTIDQEKGAVTWIKVNATEWYGWGTLGFGNSALTDGNKGAITVSSLGTVWSLNVNTVSTGRIVNDAVTYAKMQNVSATNRFIGRITSGAGDPEELTGAQATSILDVFTTSLKGLAPASGGGTSNFLRADGTWAAPTAVSDGDKGDVVVSSSGTVWTIDANAVTYAKMQNVSTTSRILGRITTGAGVIEELTGTQLTTLVNTFTTTLKGLVPASGGGTTTFLRADGTFAVAIPDGDKGDITSSSSGTVWTIDSDAVTYAKIQNVSATSRILGRISSGAGDIEELTQAQVGTILLTGVSSGDLLYNNSGVIAGFGDWDGSRLQLTSNQASTNTVEIVLALNRTSTGTPAVGLGASITSALEYGGSGLLCTGRFSHILTDASTPATKWVFTTTSTTEKDTFAILSTGDVQLGSTSLSGDRKISVVSSTTSANLTVTSQGVSSAVILGMPGGVLYLGELTSGINNRYVYAQGSSTDINVGLFAKGAGVLYNSANTTQFIPASGSTGGVGEVVLSTNLVTIRAAQNSTTLNGFNVAIAGGQGGPTGTTNGGNLTLRGGAGVGGGTNGRIVMELLPTSASGLTTGMVWNNAGVLNIV